MPTPGSRIASAVRGAGRARPGRCALRRAASQAARRAATASRPGRAATATRRCARWRWRTARRSVLLAHHRRDQAETLLLQALRGAGVGGPGRHAARGRARRHHLGCGPGWARPRDDIDAYVRRHRLHHIEDDSNADPRFARNRLRLQVWPALTAGVSSSAESTLADSGGAGRRRPRRALDELAAHRPGGSRHARRPRRGRVARAVVPARRSNALRAWLQAQRGQPAPAEPGARADGRTAGARAKARWPMPAGELRLLSRQPELRRRRAAAAVPARRARDDAEPARAGRHAAAGLGRAPRACAGGARAACRWPGWPNCDLRARCGRRAVPGRHRPPAAQPEEAVPGGRRAGLGARRAAGLQRRPTGLRARPGPRCACASACPASRWCDCAGAAAATPTAQSAGAKMRGSRSAA